MRKSLRDLAREINEEAITKKEARALKRAKYDQVITMKVYPMDLNILLSRGWEVLSHTPTTYASNQSFIMKIDAAVLRERLGNASKV